MQPSITTTEAIDTCARESHEGMISFGAVVARLTAVDVESYHADYRRRETTYYLQSGAIHVVALHAPEVPVAARFDAEAVGDAIRGAQRGDVKYPEFVRRTMAAGCVGYCVWIAGRQVVYFGRRGETHVEPFPAAPTEAVEVAKQV